VPDRPPGVSDGLSRLERMLVCQGGRVVPRLPQRCQLALRVHREDRPTLSENFCLESPVRPAFSIEIIHFKGFDIYAGLAEELPY
jgi:hypothetical protein